MVIVPQHVYLALSDLEQKVKELKKEAQRRAEANIDNADELAFWAAYACGVGEALDMIKETADHI